MDLGPGVTTSDALVPVQVPKVVPVANALSGESGALVVARYPSVVPVVTAIASEGPVIDIVDKSEMLTEHSDDTARSETGQCCCSNRRSVYGIGESL